MTALGPDCLISAIASPSTASLVLADLKAPPGNSLEALKADRKGQHSIRINDQWRVCFVWTADGATQVEIIDYH